MSKSIVVSFDQYGNQRIEALGFEGRGCVEATQYIELALAGAKTKDDDRPEMYSGGATTSNEANLRF